MSEINIVFSDAPSDISTSDVSLVRWLLVHPSAQARVFDVHFQAVWYDFFHRAGINKLSHLLCMAPITWALLALGAAVPLVGPVHLGIVFAMVMTIGFFLKDRVLGVLYGAAMVLMLALVAKVGSVASAVAVLAVAGALQTWTHGLEDIPPPISGHDGFRPVPEFIREAPTWRVVLSSVMLMTVYIGVEIISSPRLLAVQLLIALDALGLPSGTLRKARIEANELYARRRDLLLP